VFRRRRSADVGQDRDEEPDGPDLYDDEFDESATEEQPAGVPRAEGGPWDAGEPYPARERVDLGSVRVPVGPDYEIQLVMADQHGAWVTVRHGQSEVQLQAFAAARRGALWDDVRGEIADEVRRAGGGSEERPGPFGVELVARVPAEPGQPAAGETGAAGPGGASTARAGSCAGCSPARPRSAARQPARSRTYCGTWWWFAASTRCHRGTSWNCACLPRPGRRSKSRRPQRRRTGSAPT